MFLVCDKITHLCRIRFSYADPGRVTDLTLPIDLVGGGRGWGCTQILLHRPVRHD